MMSIIFFALSALALAILAALNARQIAKDRDAVNGMAKPHIQYFAEVEVRRAWMRASGWSLFFAAMIFRLSLEEGLGRTWTVTGIILFGFGVFVAEALWGRRERKRMMRGEK